MALPGLDLTPLGTDLPIVLFPVRLETRFDAARSVLRVRIYPDEIFADSHEPELTERELAAGQAYWQAVGRAPDEAGERAAWRQLVQGSSGPRAAWIAEATRGGSSPLKLQSWTRPAMAPLLPDVWLAVGYRDGIGEVSRATSRPVKSPLQLTLSPADKPSVDLSGDGLTIDPELLWTVDYDKALEAGMAIDLPLPELGKGLDRLLVAGVVRLGRRPEDLAQSLASLLDAHRFTRGLALVAQGTPTNNTAAAPAGFPPPDPDAARSFEVERKGVRLTPGCDGERLLRAFGLAPQRAAHLAGADRDELTPARAMNDALWPAGPGYFLENILVPRFQQPEIRAVREYFVAQVPGRGPIPAFRVGAVPYGVLPVTSLRRFQADPRHHSMFEMQLPDVLRRLLPLWRAAVPGVPRIGRGGDPDESLLQVLGMDAGTREVRVRNGVGPVAIINLCQSLGFLGALVWTVWYNRQRQTAERGLRPIGEYPDWMHTRLPWTSFLDAARVGLPLVAAGPLSETAPLDPNDVAWVRNAPIQELRTAPPPATLLGRVLRHAALREYARLAYDLLIGNPVNEVHEWERYERELWGIPGSRGMKKTIWEYFDGRIGLNGVPFGDQPKQPLGEFLLSPENRTTTAAEVRSYQASLRALEALPAAELERLLTETLDVSSHRIDAWVTSLAARRLTDLRKAQTTEATHFGAFAWVEGLRPAASTPVLDAEGNPVIVQGKPLLHPALRGGYVQAPSLTHGAAAAVLRNAHLTHETPAARERYAVDLSSARVRAVRQVLDSVRNGQNLGAVLGYQFERGLHDRHLDKYIAPVRRLFPLVADKGGSSGEPVEAIAARNVADGLRLRAAWRGENGKKVFGVAPDVPADEKAEPGFTAELERLDRTIDAVADLLSAESVFQLVRGNTSGGAASLDALAQGLRPPDPQILDTPRSGVSLTHRVAVVLGAGPLPHGPWRDTPTPRAAAEPFLDGWAGTVLGDPHQVRCRVSLPDPSPEDPKRRKEVTVTLADLDLRPLDVLALAEESAAAGEDSELDRRVAQAAGVAGPDVRILYAADPAWDRGTVRTFLDILEVARALASLIHGARPLRPDELCAPQSGSAGRVDESEIAKRAKDAADALDTAAAALAAARTVPFQLDKLQDALRQAALFGVPGAYPPLGATEKELLPVAESIQTELDRRRAAAKVDGTGLASSLARLRAVFGEGFNPLPRFAPADPGAIGKALASPPDTSPEPSAVAVGKWLQQAARVRPALGRWRLLQLGAQALGRGRARLDLAQLPFKTGERWTALPVLPGKTLRDGTVSLVLHRAVEPAVGNAWAGLLIDEWTEVVPHAVQSTGLAFHFDNPGAEAPQTILIAVPPDPAAPHWTEEDLLATLNETLDLAKVRAVDLELLGELGQMLPTLFFADDAGAGNTITTSFDDALLAEREVKP